MGNVFRVRARSLTFQCIARVMSLVTALTFGSKKRSALGMKAGKLNPAADLEAPEPEWKHWFRQFICPLRPVLCSPQYDVLVESSRLSTVFRVTALLQPLRVKVTSMIQLCSPKIFMVSRFQKRADRFFASEFDYFGQNREPCREDS